MFAVSQYVAGIAIIHVAWALFALCGTLIWTPRIAGPPPPRLRGEPGAVLELVVVSATGMAILGLCSFVLGMLGLLYPATLLIFAVAVFVACAVLGDSPLKRAFWTVRIGALSAAGTPVVLALYACTLVAAVPAVFPETAFDATFYHLVYGLDWAHAHRIYVDQAVRFPYYAHNWILLDTWMFELHLDAYIDFLGWLAGALSVLATYGIVDALAPHLGRTGKRIVPATAMLAALAVLLAPVFERYVDTGMVDVAIGFFFVASVAATVMAVATRDRRWTFYTLLTFSFFVGSKGSFLAFLPIAVAATWIAARTTRLAMRTTVTLCALAFCFCIPWYAKNFIQAGDPIPPYLNLALNRVDSKWTHADMAGVMDDLHVDQTPAFLALLPIEIVTNPTTRDFREPGVSLIMLFVFVPGIVFIYLLLKRRNALTSFWVVFSVLLFYSIAYWLVTTHIGRYALLFYPTLAAFLGLLVVKVAHGSIERRAIALIAFACCALPAPVSATWVSTYWESDIADVPDTYLGQQAYLTANLPAYSEEERISHVLDDSAISDRRVYVVGDYQTAFYFKEHDVTYLGDWFGPERFGDFALAIDTGKAVDFLRGLRIDAVLLSPHPLFAADRVAKLTMQLTAAGYRKEQLPGRPALMFFGPGEAK